jgi:hypothetical protein
MQLPLFLFRRNPPGRKPRGLFDLFDSDSEEADASPADGGGDAPSADQPALESPLDYARRQAQLALWEIATLGTGGLTRDPLTGEIYASKFGKRLGDRMSEIAQRVPFGPGRAGGPSRPTGPAAVRTQPQAGSGFLFGGPQAKASENQVYSVRSGANSGEDDECVADHEEDMEECGQKFSYNRGAFGRCANRAGIRLGQCASGVPRRQRMPRWSDADEDGEDFSRRPKAGEW